MKKRWLMAEPCHSVLSELLASIRGASLRGNRTGAGINSAANSQAVFCSFQTDNLGSDRSTSEPQVTPRALKKRRLDKSSNTWVTPDEQLSPLPRRGFGPGDISRISQPQDMSEAFSPPEVGMNYPRVYVPYDGQSLSTAMGSIEPQERYSGGPSSVAQ